MHKTTLLVVLVVLCGAALVAAKHHKKHKIDWAKPAINHNIIHEVNSDPESTWTAGVNEKFKSMKLSEVKAFLGAKLDGKKLPPREFNDNENLALPDEFDVRTQWGSKCPSTLEVRDQSLCGSCWAFGAAEAITDRVCIASKGAKQPHLSATDLLACCDTCGDGCDGGYLAEAWQYWVDNGLVTGGNYSKNATDNGCFPYPFPPCAHHVNSTVYPPCAGDEYETPSCPNKCSNGAKWSQDKVYGKTAYSVEEDEEKIKQDLYQYGSLEVAFTVYEDFVTYKSGVYKHKTGSALGGHAVKMIGWGVENGVKYWTIVNSWNDQWGDKGAFKIVRGTNECGIEDSVVGGLPK